MLKSRNPFKNVCFGKGSEKLNFTMRVFKNTKIHWFLKGFRKIAFRNEMFFGLSIIDFLETMGSGFVVSDSVSGPIGVTKMNDTFFRSCCLAMWMVAPYDIVAGGFLLGSGYCRRNRWRFLEYILFFGECVLGPALIFGRIGPRPAPWAALLFEHNSRPRENGRRKKMRGGAFKKRVTFIFVTPIVLTTFPVLKNLSST